MIENMSKREELYNYYKSQFDEIEIDESNHLIKKYSSIEREYNLIHNGVGIRDLSRYSKIFIHGKDSVSLLRRLATNRIIDLKVLEWVRTLFVNFEGNIIDRTLLMKFEDYFILIGYNTEKQKLFKWINRFIINDDISLSDSSDEYTIFEVMGSQATSYMTMILGDKFYDFKENNILRVQVEDFFVHGIKINDCGAVDKYIILIDSKNAIRTLEIMEENKSVFDFGMVGEDAYNIFRIENGIPTAPNELNDSVNPSEVYLNSEVSNLKHDYMGHENVEDKNVNLSRLVKIKFKHNADSLKLPLSIIDDKNMEIGVITSFANNNIIKFPIGLGFIDFDLGINGNSYFATDGKNKIEIIICELRK